jgi:predicted permease
MSDVSFKFWVTALVVIVSMAAGYLSRRRNWVSPATGERLMTFVAVVGYPVVGFLTLWGTRLHRSDALMPILAVAHTVIMTFVALGISRWITADRAEKGLFAIAGGLGNNGFTMGAFVLYLLEGETGMGIANIYFILFMLVVVFVSYPLARHYATSQPSQSMGQLIWHSLWDWRSIGLPVGLAGIALSALAVARPPQISAWHVVDVLVYSVTPMAFFGIGLGLHFSRIQSLWRMLIGLAIVRFGLGAVLALILAWLTWLTPWPMRDLRFKVYFIEGFVPTAVTMVAVANMFGLRPQEASALFVVNTTMYLVFVLPLVLWLG